jgi:formylglycine-generating enzyme required for sulfatase activity
MTSRFVCGLAAVLLVGCTNAPEDGSEAAPSPALIQFDLPPDATWRRPADAEATAVSSTPIEVEPGTHDLEIAYHCTSGAIRFEARAGETTVVDLASVQGLQLATFIPRATSLTGVPLGVDVFLGLDGAPKLASVGFGESVTVPACAERIRIAATDPVLQLGGFIEDIEFAPGGVVTREVVLSRGPDMVRIHGGKMRYTERDLRHPLDIPRAQWGKTVEKIAEVPTFDIDRTEVTTDQYIACSYDAMTRAEWDQFGQRAVCDSREECGRRGACFERGFDGGPSELCTADVAWREKPYRADGLPRIVRPGKGSFPMNCIGYDAAERYCAWVGKRLAIAIEFEFAARSGRFERENLCAENDEWCFWRRTTFWGWNSSSREENWIIDRDPPGTAPVKKPADEWAERSRRDMAKTAGGPHQVCAPRSTRTRQGVCDMLHNVQEWVAWSRTRRCGQDSAANGTRERCENHMIGTRGGSWLNGYEEVFRTTRLGITRHSKEVFGELLGPDADVTLRGHPLSPMHDYYSHGHVDTGGERIGFRCVRDVEYERAEAAKPAAAGPGTGNEQ